jgi:hypothetical protein
MFKSIFKFRIGHILPILFSILTGLVIVTGENVALASHSSTAHNVFMHSAAHTEAVCVDTQNSTMAFSTALDRVKNTLRDGNPSSDWHGLAGNKILFSFNTARCSLLTSSQLSTMRMRVYVYDNNTANCFNNSNASCVKHYSASGSHNGQTDWAYEKVFLKGSHVSGSAFYYHHTIGHEFGHVFGLNDPSDCAATSIMHSAYYGCTDHEWPTSSDRTSVTNIANSYNPPWYP